MSSFLEAQRQKVSNGLLVQSMDELLAVLAHYQRNWDIDLETVRHHAQELVLLKAQLAADASSQDSEAKLGRNRVLASYLGLLRQLQENPSLARFFAAHDRATAEWEGISFQPELESLRQYAERHPFGMHTPKANALASRLEHELRMVQLRSQSRQDELAWEQARHQDSLPAFEDYLRQFPQGAHAEQARARALALQARAERQRRLGEAWGEAQRLPEAAALRRFAERFPGTEQAREALLQAQALERFERQRAREREAWQEVLRDRSLEALRRYLVEFSEGAHSQEAIALLTDMENRSKAGALGQSIQRQASELGRSSAELYLWERGWSAAWRDFFLGMMGASNSLSDQELLDLAHMERLDCSNLDLRELGPLAHLPLRSLKASAAQVRDLGPLRGLRQLETLGLAFNPIDDLGPLAGLPLRALDLSHTLVRDARPLAQCPSLERLDISATPIASLAFLAKLPALKALVCDRKALEALAKANFPKKIKFSGISMDEIKNFNSLINNDFDFEIMIFIR